MSIEKLGSVSGAEVVMMKESGSVNGSQSGPVSVHGDKIIEENQTDFAKNPFDKYSADDYDRFNTLLSGRNGADAQKFAKVITSDVNKDYTKFKQEYPDSTLKLPEPPNPADFDKGPKGYNAYREALLLWKSECEQSIESARKELSPKEPEKQEPPKNEVEPEQPGNDKTPASPPKKTPEPKTPKKPPVEDFDLEKKIREDLEKERKKESGELDYKKMAELWLEAMRNIKLGKPKEEPNVDPRHDYTPENPFPMGSK